MSSPDDALTSALQLVTIIAESAADIARMPRLARPLVKRGFHKRTGMSHEQWRAFADELVHRLRVAAGAPVSVRADTVYRLERLLTNYRTAPERAARFIRDPKVMEMVRERCQARADGVAQLLSALREQGVG